MKKVIAWVGGGLLVVLLGMASFMVLRSRMEPEVAGGPPGARLITAEQYANAIHDVFGEDIRVEANFISTLRRQGLLSLQAAQTVATPGLLSELDRAARGVATQVVDERRRKALIPCEPRAAASPDDECAGKFFTQVGLFLFRRPLNQAELKIHVLTAHAAAETYGNFYAGLAHSLAGMLISPKFLYLYDSVEPDPEHPGRYRLDAWSKATRLSFFLWDSLPDGALLATAKTGKLHEQAELQRQVERLLASPERLERGTRAFFADLLMLDKFDVLTKDSVIYPAFTSVVTQSAREQILRTVADHLLVENRDYRDLFTTSSTFVNRTLAPLQHVPARGTEWVKITLDQPQTAGVLTSLGFLAAQSHPGRSSPTLRGKAIREALLCQKVPDPPPNVNFTAFEGSLETMKTARDRLHAHSSDATCAGCHKIMDPIGLALENFDGAGAFRTSEKGARIDTSGSLDGQSFADAKGLGQALHDHRAVSSCLVTRLFSYAVGRETIGTDRPWLAYATKRFAADDYRYRDLLQLIATRRAFFAVAAPRQRADSGVL